MFKKFYLLITLLTAFLLGGTGSAWGEQLNEGFESSTFPPDGWSTIHVSGAKSWARSTGYKHGGSASAFMSYASSGHENYLITPQLAPASGEKLNFYAYAQYNYATTVKVEVSTTDNAQGSFTPIQTYTTGTGKDIPLSWTNLVIDLSDYVGQNIYIAFHIIDADGTNLYIDDVSGVTIKGETCPKTGKPAASSVGTTTATISWTPVGTETTWNLRYKKANAASWTEVNGLTSTSHNLTSLSSGTTYNYEVQADCGGGDKSDWKAGTDFSTECATATLPFEPTITAGSKPNCWTIADGSWGDGWSGRWYTYVYSSKNCLRYQGAKGSAEAFVQTPSIVLSGKAVLKFKYANYNGGRRCPAKVYVSDGTTTKSVTLTNTDDATLTDAEIDLSNVSGTNFTGKTITIKFSGSGHSSSSGTGYVWIADIQVEAVQDCTAPQNVVLSGSSSSTADFAWDANAGVNSYEYCVVEQGQAASGYQTVNTNSKHVDGLTPGNYTFYVKCACGTAASSLDFEIVSCPSVTEVTLSDQVWNGATVNWTTSASTNCDVQYKAGSGNWTAAATNLNATSKTITGLSVGTEYSFRVKPNCGGEGTWVTCAETHTPACPALGALTLSGKTYNGVTVSWSAVAGISKWNLRYRKGSDSWIEVNDISGTSHTIESGLVTNSEYTIEVYSECGGSPMTTTYTPIYEIPAVLSALNVKDVTANLSWSTVDGASGYQYSCVKTGQADAWSATQVTNSASLSGLEVAEEYTAKVRAIFATGNSDPKEKVFSTVCQAPTSLVKGATTSSSLAFSWSKSADGVDNRYQYVCKEGSTAPTADQWASAVLLGEDVLTATVEGLSANTTYYFFVRSYYSDGKYSDAISTNNTTDCGIESIGWSETFGSTAATKPTCWTISNWGTTYGNEWTSASDYAHSGVALKYNAKTSSSSDAISPSIYIAEKCTLCFYVRNAVGNGEAYVQCQVFINDGTSDTEITDLTTNVSGTTSSVNTRYTSATAKYYDLSSFVGKTITIRFKGKGYSSQTTSYLWIDDVSINYKACATPTSLAAAPTTDGAIVTWNHDEADGHYDLQYRVHVDEGDPNEWIDVTNIAEKTKTLTGLTPGTTYDVRVRANCSAHRQSAWTSDIQFSPECVAPTSISKTAETFNSVELEWVGSANALRYKKGEEDWTNVLFDPAVTSYDGLTGLTTGEEYTVQVHAACGDHWSSDFVFTPTCVAPSDLAVSSPSASGATLDWTVNSGEDEWIVQYRKKGAADWTTVENIAAHPYALSGLQPGRNYEVKVAAACNGTYTAAEEFHTGCAAQAPLGYTEDFENFETGNYEESKLLCWAELNATHTDAFTSPRLYVGTDYVKTGSKSLNLASNASAYVYAILPEFSGSYAGLQLTFSHKEENASNSGAITVGYMTDPTDASTFQPLHAAFSRSTSWQTEVVYLDDATSGSRIAFKYGGGASNYYVGIDDIAISNAPTCFTPTALTAGSITKNSATISWTKGKNETAWKLQYTTNTENWGDEIAVSTTPSKALSGLSARTLYYVRVKADCGGEDESDYTDGTFTFKTDCDFVEMPFAEGFANTLPECWHLAVSGADNWEYYTTAYHTAAPSMRFNANTATENYGDLITPYIDVDDDANLTFYLKNTLEINAKLYAQVDGEAAVEVQTLPTTTTANFELQTVDLSSYVGNHVRFIFRAYGNNTEYNYIYIDDVNVSVKPCDAPTFTATNVTTTTVGANISCAGNWSLRYKKSADADWTEVLGLTTSPYNITGCDNGVAYDVQVRTDCSASRHSAWTASQHFTPQCLAPTALSAAPAVNSASISWTGDAGKLQYREFAAEEPLNEWTTVSESVTSPYNITGLTASTKYEVRVQASCAGENTEAAWTSIASFTTWCDGAASLPIEEASFTAVPECWRATFKNESSGVAEGKINFYGSEEQLLVLPYISANLNTLSVTFTYNLSSATADFGYIDAPNGEFHAFTSQPESEVELDLAAEAAAPKYIAVRYNGGSSVGSHLLISSVLVRQSPTCWKPGTPSVTAITPVGATFSWTAGASETQWQYIVIASSAAEDWSSPTLVNTNSVSLTGLNAGTSYKFYVRSYCGAEDQSDAAVSAAFTTATVAAPTEVAVSDITTNGATASWTAADGVSQYQYVVMEQGVAADWTSPTTVTTNAATLSGLNAGTTYDFYVRSFYAATATSDAVKVTFHTNCAVITVDATHPYAETFNSLESGIPACWDNSVGTTENPNYKWKSATGGQDGKCVMFNGTDNGLGNTNVLATPVFSIEADADLFFYWKNAKTGAYTVEISVDGGAHATLISGLTGKNAWTLQEISLAAYYDAETPKQIQLFFCGTSAGDGNANLYLDEVQIIPAGCRKPASRPEASGISANGATLTWGESPAGHYQYSLVEQGNDPDWKAIDTNSKDFVNLQPTTTYDFAVRSVCGEESYSDTLMVTFRTLCAEFSLPFEENFNGLAYQAIPECWNNDEGTSADSYKWKAETPVGSSNYVRFNSSTNEEGATSILATPLIQLGEGNLLTFKAKNPTGGDFKVQIEGEGIAREDLITGITDLADWTLKYAVIPAKFNNKKVQLFFHATSNGNNQYAYIDIDDVRVARGEVFTDGTADVQTRLGEINGQTVDFVMDRPMQFNGYYNTLCLPFSLSAEQLADADCPLYNNTIVRFDYTRVVNGELEVYIARASSIDAGVPYLVKYDGAAEDDRIGMLFKNVTISATEPSNTEKEALAYKGVFNKQKLAAQTDASILYVSGQNKLFWPEADRYIYAFRAYFEAVGGVSAPIRGFGAKFVMNSPEIATDIDAVNSDDINVRKVIENGQLFIIRDGKRYSVQGILVK